MKAISCIVGAALTVAILTVGPARQAKGEESSAKATHSETVMVGDIQIDPQDFLLHQDPQTRIASCLACHGHNAAGDIDFGPDVHFGTPALRGLQRDYLRQSLIDYKGGRRTHKEMNVIASMLDQETIEFMARTFAAYPTPVLKSIDEIASLADKDTRFRRGWLIAQQGLPNREIPACTICHGELGEGIADVGPRLAGQNKIYIQQQLMNYANSMRETEQSGLMKNFATHLSSDDVESIAYYYEQIVIWAPPRPAN